MVTETVNAGVTQARKDRARKTNTTSSITLAQALDAIDAALAPLDAQDRANAVRLLAGLETPQNAGMVAATLAAAIEYSKTTRRVAPGGKIYQFPTAFDAAKAI